jgi:hypothetical protein
MALPLVGKFNPLWFFVGFLFAMLAWPRIQIMLSNLKGKMA